MSAARWVLVAAIAAAASYVASWDRGLPAAADIAWKGAGVGLLAVYAGLATSRAPSRADARLLVAVMAMGALADMLLEVHFIAGALAFLAGHLTAVWLYLRNRRQGLGGPELAAGLALVPLIAGAAWLLPVDRGAAPGITFYATGLGAMAAAAWLSRFPRALTGTGALMFAVSDLLIFLRMGRPALDTFPMGLAVWGLYFAGQATICLGVARHLAAPSLRVRTTAREPA